MYYKNTSLFYFKTMRKLYSLIALSALTLLSGCELVGDIFPPGVANFLCGGRECGDAMGRHPLVAKMLEVI